MTTNKDAFREYLSLEKKYSPHTVNAYLNDVLFFESYNKECFEQENIDQVHYPQIRNWIVSLIDDGLSNVSVNRKIASLKAYFKFLLKIQQITSNPLLQHRALKTPKKIQIPFSEKELEAVLAQFQDPKGFEEVRDKLIIDLFYTTGIRRSELINLQNHNINLANATIKVLGKRNKERIIPIVPVLAAQIFSYRKEKETLTEIIDSDYFFLTKKGLKLNDSFVYRLINSYFSGVSEKVKKSPHIIRHSFATHLLNNGADLNSVKELLGHSSLASTQIYTHNSLSELKKVFNESHPRGSK
ncbi:tyrosine-type recombinase/integrase [Flavobacterium restrictum]|uniref:Tyrosine-type recombinase/integrase n=1 Tax=Flavobacterium restrictum TaxID=2594428 RepID=A0A553EB62_9FLAO|nr:tyrosine-type recombinase/integrase [Flavobacterium restrictum]TRX42192.1 tyrosine-type recombinase/integrase [Flavobacterium restrictum]